VQSDDEEYMMAVVCDDHRKVLEQRLPAMQKEDKIPKGKLRFQSVRTVGTDCITGLNEDYIDLELKRGVCSDRKLT
jgi:hypothetical protein